MLNEALYECLVDVGANEEKAKRAASENEKLKQLCQDVADLRKGQAEMYRQTAQINERLIDVEALVRVLLQRQEKTDKDIVGIKGEISGVKGEIAEMKGMLQILLDRG